MTDLPGSTHPATHLSADRRATDLDALAAGSTLVDVLVIGGGVTGVGVALDAASRGLSVALAERADLAFGTSRWSSKLVHGGMRYLASGDVHLAYESARERAALMGTIAPHLVRPLPMMMPFDDEVPRTRRALLMAGARAGEALRAAARTEHGLLPNPRNIGVEEALRWIPALKRAHLSGALLAWDGQLEDDARLVVALARTAAAHGARILTYTSAVTVRGDGARLRDERTGTEFDVRARAVVNATGVWADTLEPEVQLRPSKGTHAVLRASSLGSPVAALMAPVPGEPNRYVFALPHPDGTVHVGLTDDPIEGRPDVPRAQESELTFLLDTLTPLLERPLSRADVVGSFAGLRPLVAGKDPNGRTADLSRRHLVHRGASGVVTIVGGKLTTYRRMAEDTVDALALNEEPCRTRSLPLVGASRREALSAVPAPGRLVRRYGTEAPAVAALAAADPALLAPVADGVPVLGVEFAWGVLAEGALTVEDLLERRTRLSLVPADEAAARDRAAEVLERYLPATRSAAAGVEALPR